MKKSIVPYVFLSPFLLLYLVFFGGPVIVSLLTSFTEWNVMSPPKFTGLENYINLLKDPTFWIAFKNTVIIVITGNIITIGLALVLAVLIEEFIAFSLKKFFRTLFFIPEVASLAVVAMIFSLIYNKEAGLLNGLLRTIGINSTIGWLTNSRYAIWSIIALRTWRVAGYFAVFIVAGLEAIPKETYEAAEIDGATSSTLFFKITLHLLKPILLFIAVWSTVWGFVVFDEPWILNQGGPGTSTLTIVMYLYMNGFRFFKLGYAATISYILTMIIFASSYFIIKSRKSEGLEGFES
ncbi:MAG: sugar ABC transporter permease [Candidatus Atribacteria bacterium]|nr:sugar ABC transporter permease [Candidatus Atribacteria bacterium]